MKLVWPAAFFIICVGVTLRGTFGAEVVNVGAIFTSSSINGAVSKIAMEAAQDDVNSDPTILGGRKLSITIHDSNFSGFLSIIGALQFMETDTVAIIGPQNAIMAHVLSHLANQLNVPLLSFTALDPTLSPLQYPYFVQTAPNDQFEMAAIAEMVSYYGWAEVIAIYTDDDQSRNGITTLGDKLAERRCKITYKAVLPPDTKSSRDDIQRELVKIQMMESRVIILNAYEKTGLMAFEVAKSLGMMGKGYVWIATTWLSTVLDSKPPIKPNSLLGVLTLRPHTPDSKKKRDFVSRWPKLSNGSIGLNPYGLYAYDTVWILANALKLFFNSGGNISFSDDPRLSKLGGGSLNLEALSIFDGGPQLLKNILQTNMTGLTGPIAFDEIDRSPYRPSYDIINVVEKGYRDIGYWSNYSGLSIVPPETLYGKPPNRSSSNQQLYSVVWPGDTTEKPRGWVFANNGEKMTIGVPNRFSFKAVVSWVNGSEVASGYCIDVFLAAIKYLPYPVPYKFVPFGNGHNNPSYDELVGKIATGEFDAVVGDVAIVTNRTKLVDFTQPYIESGLVVVAPVRKMKSSALAFLQPFTPLMWAVTGILFLVVGAVVWILEHRINDEFRGPPKQQFVTMLWFSFSTMFFAHRENTVSTLGRFVLIIWLFVVLIINSSYTASLTSILTVQQLSSPIKGIDSLITSNDHIGYQVGSFAENYMIEELSIPRSRLLPLGTPEEYASALEKGLVSAIVDERPYVDLFLSQHCHFSIRGQEFTKSAWGFAFPRDSPLAIDMSTAILTLSENGELQKIHDKWLSKKGLCPSQGSDDDTDQLHLGSFLGLFLICGTACFLALAIYFCSMLRSYIRHKPPQEEEKIAMAESENNKNASVHEPGNQSEGDDLEWYSDNLEENSDYDLSEGSVDLNELIDVNIDKEDENSKGPQTEWQEDQEATYEIDDEEKEYNSELNNILTPYEDWHGAD
ncbi:hypothetical protein ACFE04_012778 [Oxalis oulophora]